MEEPSNMPSEPISLSLQQMSKDSLQQLFDISPDALLVIDRTGNIVIINAQIERIFGYSRSELLGHGMGMLLPKRFRNIHVMHREQYFAACRPRPMGIGLQLFGLRKDETEFPVDISLRPLLLDNELHVIAAIRDMTEQKRAEQELKSLHEQQKRYDTFLSMASHELRTPLASIQVITQMFTRNLDRPSPHMPEERKAMDDIIREALEEMTSQIARLNRLISDLLDVSRTSEGHLSLTLSDFEIGELVQETVKTLQKTVNTHTIVIYGKGKQCVHADRDRISQVLINLINNAVKYSPGAQHVDVTLSDTQDRAIVSIRDYGIGIAREYQPHLFERYYRLIDEEHKKYAGLGIGLYIAAEIVKRHHGNIWVESDPGKGATFSFSLPGERGKHDDLDR